MCKAKKGDEKTDALFRGAEKEKRGETRCSLQFKLERGRKPRKEALGRHN